MKAINSPEIFKTCYIAQVNEELGFPVRIAANRRGDESKIEAKEELGTLYYNSHHHIVRKRTEDAHV